VNHRLALFFFVIIPPGALLLAEPSAGGAQDEEKPLVWGADCDGGVPYVIQANGKAAEDEPNGPVTGFEADIRDALAKETGRRIVFKQLKFDNLYVDLDQGNCDFAMNGLEIVPQNTARADFSKPYYLYQQQFVVRADEKAFATLEECRKLDLTVGTLGGSAAEKVLKDLQFSKDQINASYQDQNGLYADLSLGRNIRGVVLDLPAAIYYTKPYPQLLFGMGQKYPGLKFLGQPFAEGRYGIAVKKGNAKLLAQLNDGIDALKQKGDLKRILEKWDLWDVDQYKLDADVKGDAPPPPVWTFDSYFPLLLHGAYYTVLITLCGFGLAMLIGLPLSLMRLYGPWYLRALATIYVEFFRGIPVLLLLYFLYYGLGHFGGEWNIDWLKLGPYTAAVLGFGLNYAAYEAEIYRAGISSIPVGQWEAAASLGMAPPLTFRRIILPQAIRVMLPPMTNDFVALFKDTSVVSIIAVTELSTQYQILTKSGGGYVEIGLCTAALYLIMSVPLGYLSRYLEKRWGVKG
jgi:polar amino acid transport system substrate-binding protein